MWIEESFYHLNLGSDRFRNVHRRIDAATGFAVAWLTDYTRSFVASTHPILKSKDCKILGLPRH
jgi:hypothetical protein